MHLRRFLLVVVVLTLAAVCCIVGARNRRGEPTLNCMAVGDRILESADNIQLTLRSDGISRQTWVSPNGKYAACVLEDEGGSNSSRIKIMEVDTRRELLVLDRKPYQDALQGKAKLQKLVWTLPELSQPIFWLQNGREFVTAASRLSPSADGKDVTEEQFMVVMNTRGQVRLSLPLTEGQNVRGLAIDPFGLRVACLFEKPDTPPSTEIVAWDTRNGTSEVVVTKSGAYFDLFGWTNGGDAVLCLDQEYWKDRKLLCIDVKDRTESRIECGQPAQTDSPDRAFQVKQDVDSLEIVSRAIGKVVRKLAGKGLLFCAWLPNSQMFTYYTTSPLGDGPKGSGASIKHLWLATLEDNKLNRMCAALCVDPSSDPAFGPSWSSDLTSLGYTSGGQSYIARFRWRDSTLDEKVAVGLPVNEEEMKGRLAENAKQLGLAIKMYTCDWDNVYPSQDSFKEGILPYMRDEDLMLKPGTEENIFHYFPQKDEKSISEPSKTVIGEIDAGYSWLVRVYADGHVETSDKR